MIFSLIVHTRAPQGISITRHATVLVIVRTTPLDTHLYGVRYCLGVQLLPSWCCLCWSNTCIGANATALRMIVEPCTGCISNTDKCSALGKRCQAPGYHCDNTTAVAKGDEPETNMVQCSGILLVDLLGCGESLTTAQEPGMDAAYCWGGALAGVNTCAGTVNKYVCSYDCLVTPSCSSQSCS